MEIESKYKGQTEQFAGADYLSSPTSVQSGQWGSVSGVILDLGAARRINGKSVFGKSSSAVLGFSSIKGSVIVQLRDSVAFYGQEFFG